MSKRMTFLINPPPAGKRAAKTAKKRKATRTNAPRPAGRAGTTTAAPAAKPRPNGGTTVATKKRKRRRSTTARKTRTVVRYRSNPAPKARRSGRRFRRNPQGFSASAIVPTLVQGAKDAGLVVAGKAAARLVRGKLKFDGNTTTGSLVEVAVGVGLGMLAGKMGGADMGRMVLAGALSGPIETIVKQAKIPEVSTALGDEGELAGEFDDLGDLGAYSELGAYSTGLIPAAAGVVGDVDDLGDVDGAELGDEHDGW